MNIEITSVSHKEQRAVDVAAAVDVITQEDIRRSGMTTVPELLRLVPGVQVAQINSNKWAVTVRGFNNLFADKLLVLVDGRTVYDRLNSGLFWESVDIPLDQIERIEVVRGPGGATWGANAVNGVINIVTKSAAALPGLRGQRGRRHVRRGARGRALWRDARRRRIPRVFAGVGAVGIADRCDDAGRRPLAEPDVTEFRLDWTGGADALMVEGGATLQKAARVVASAVRTGAGRQAGIESTWAYTEEYSVLGRWTRRRDTGAALEVQSSVDFRHNEDGPSPSQTNFDLDAQYHTALGSRHDVVAGAGYRLVDERVPGCFTFSITPGQVVNHVFKLFAQDEIALGRRVHLTLGTKVERDTYAGWAVQPTARVMWRFVSAAACVGRRLAGRAHAVARRRVGPQQLHVVRRSGRAAGRRGRDWAIPTFNPKRS